MGLSLEDFDDAAPVAASGPSAEWLDGHAAGLREGRAAGRAATEAEGGLLLRELGQTIGDMTFGYAEARGQVLLALGPLFQLVIERLLPAVAGEALAPWLAEAVAEAARADVPAALVVAVHPSRAEALAACLPPAAAGGRAGALVVPDASLGPNAARLAGPGAETALDLDACVAALSEALSALFDEPHRKVSHG
jgi:flagellar biosynthesis/type III secretory pathway protein FliH